MENNLTAKRIGEYFGHATVSEKLGCWKNEPGVLENIRLLPEVLSADKKFRVIIDYDPEFSRVLVQVFEDQSSLHGQPTGKTGDEIKSS